jgi:hypothetical protein
MTSPAVLDAPGASTRDGVDDELRSQIEATLRRIAGDVAALPCYLTAAAWRAVGSAAQRVTQPLTLVRSIGGLVGAGIIGAANTRTTAGPPEATLDTAGAGGVSATRDVVPPHGDHSPAASLPIDHYESLPASHVVARLEHLERHDLDAVRRFEVAHRGRRTVLGRIDQLLARP